MGGIDSSRDTVLNQPSWSIESTDPSDLPAIETLLVEAGLPLAGVREAFGDFLVARQGGEVVGAVGLERYGDAALLRSLVVSPAHRGSGLGAALTRAAIDRARSFGVVELVLLTETAATFFPRFGFESIARAEAPPAVQQSVEFTSACPQSAMTMRLRLAS